MLLKVFAFLLGVFNYVLLLDISFLPVDNGPIPAALPLIFKLCRLVQLKFIVKFILDCWVAFKKLLCALDLVGDKKTKGPTPTLPPPPPPPPLLLVLYCPINVFWLKVWFSVLTPVLAASNIELSMFLTVINCLIKSFNSLYLSREVPDKMVSSKSFSDSRRLDLSYSRCFRSLVNWSKW